LQKKKSQTSDPYRGALRKPKDWGQPCPNPDCTHYRLMHRGNIRAIAPSLTQRGKRRIFRCRTCEDGFSETCDTVFLDLRPPEDKVMMALKMLRVKVGLSDMGFVLGVTAETGLAWLRRAAQQAYASHTPLRRAWPVTQGQRAEMGSCIRRPHAQHAGPDGERRAWRAAGRQGGISFAPEFRLILAAFVGPRTFESA
jgi:hypothetical protein